MIEQSSNLLLSLMASGLISGSKIPFVDVAIGNVMETYIVRCLRNSSLDDILELFSIEGKSEFILLNNHGVPFPFARFEGEEEVYFTNMEKKANRPLLRPSLPLVPGELYVVNKAGELIAVKSFRLRNYMVNNHFLKNGNLVLDLYLNKHQALVVMEKGALVAPVSEHSCWTLFQKKGKIFKEGVDKTIIATELSDKERYIIVGKRNADIILEFDPNVDNIYAAIQGIPLYEAQKNIGEKWFEVDSIKNQWFDQECLLIQFPEVTIRPLQIELEEPMDSYKNELLEDSINALIKSRWVIFGIERKKTRMDFSFSRFQESINILKKKIHEALLLPRHTIENRKHIRGIISSIESAIASINRIWWAQKILKMEDNSIVLELLDREKTNLSKSLAVLHDRYLYYFTLIKVDDKIYLVPTSDLIILPDGNFYRLNIFTSDLRDNNFVNLDITFTLTEEIFFLQMLLGQRIAYLEFNNGELSCMESWSDIRKRTKQLEDMSMEVRGYLIAKELCVEHEIIDYPKAGVFLGTKTSLYLKFFLNKKLGI